MFKTLRRLHGHNLEHQGLNDISEAFQNFVTRARFFSIGRLRRTWSHSAVEFLKYRRLLPMLTSGGDAVDDQIDYNAKSFEVFGDLNLEMPTSSSPADGGAEANAPVAAVAAPISSSRPRRDSSLRASKKEDRRIMVTNVSSRVTANQLKSFFSKFGPVSSCHIPSEERRHTLYATLPKKTRSNLTAYITFK
ncbi:unnamed protein product [Gongylonema pulchrum]|uniref:RRM domain-containing protein n=1 Tax=Gongylonema pulchrum TaxID=637853 RepID=A0A183E416_9BILA|nr:unnamed protein product [Gongylonema pulchrum]